METPTQFYRRFRVNPRNETFSFLLRTRKELLDLLASQKGEILKAVQEVIQEMKPGYTPIIGKDFFTDNDIDSFIKKVTPIKGKDYYTREELEVIAQYIKDQIIIPKPIPGKAGVSPKLPDIKKMIQQEMRAWAEINPKEDMTKEDILRIMNEVKQTFDAKQWAEAIARAMEDLPLFKKLDFETGLKNKPVLQGGKKASAKHGGGDIVMISDLSTLTNGSLKVFTVPNSRKAIKVEMSDFPNNLYEGNGFTLNAARTQLTLTVINAPSSGSQLAYLYVI